MNEWPFIPIHTDLSERTGKELHWSVDFNTLSISLCMWYRITISSRFFGNFEADGSELVVNLENMTQHETIVFPGISNLILLKYTLFVMYLYWHGNQWIPMSKIHIRNDKLIHLYSLIRSPKFRGNFVKNYRNSHNLEEMFPCYL